MRLQFGNTCTDNQKEMSTKRISDVNCNCQNKIHLQKKNIITQLIQSRGSKNCKASQPSYAS